MGIDENGDGAGINLVAGPADIELQGKLEESDVRGKRFAGSRGILGEESFLAEEITGNRQQDG